MATMKPKLPEDLMKKLDRLGQNTDRICEKALTEGGKVMKKSVSEHLSQVVGKDTKVESRSTGELQAALGVSPVKVDKNGNYNIKLGFEEYRRDGTSNAAIANIIEYGKHGQPAKPFLAPAKRQSNKEVNETMKRVMTTCLSLAARFPKSSVLRR